MQAKSTDFWVNCQQITAFFSKKTSFLSFAKSKGLVYTIQLFDMPQGLCLAMPNSKGIGVLVIIVGGVAMAADLLP